jgi:peptidoglycan/xylan/chitin deacetylase (PgdA/CDA1 family)
MICLTGDIHHMSLGTGNQNACDITEIQAAQRFTRMLSDADVRVTFFVTGKAVVEEARDLRVVTDNPLVEVGGHGYTCFQPVLPHRIWKKATGSYNGPRWYQRWDTQKTVDVIGRRLGRRVRAWRNHMYMHGPYTEGVLLECGIDICSDGVDKHCIKPRWHRSGLAEFPINIIPDHEHLYHAERTPRHVARWQRRYRWSDDFGPRSYFIHEWTRMVIEQLRENEARGAVSNLIIHPITMYLCDRFHGFEQILEFIAGCETVHMSQLFENLLADDAAGRPAGKTP